MVTLTLKALTYFYTNQKINVFSILFPLYLNTYAMGLNTLTAGVAYIRVFIFY